MKVQPIELEDILKEVNNPTLCFSSKIYFQEKFIRGLMNYPKIEDGKIEFTLMYTSYKDNDLAYKAAIGEVLGKGLVLNNIEYRKRRGYYTEDCYNEMRITVGIIGGR